MSRLDIGIGSQARRARIDPILVKTFQLVFVIDVLLAKISKGGKINLKFARTHGQARARRDGLIVDQHLFNYHRRGGRIGREVFRIDLHHASHGSEEQLSVGSFPAHGLQEPVEFGIQ